MTQDVVLSHTAPCPGAVLRGCPSGHTAGAPLPPTAYPCVWSRSVSVCRELCFFFFFFNKWRRKSQLTPVCLPGKFHGQGNLVSYSPWGRKESDTPEQLSTHAGIFILACTPLPTPTLHPSPLPPLLTLPIPSHIQRHLPPLMNACHSGLLKEARTGALLGRTLVDLDWRLV